MCFEPSATSSCTLTYHNFSCETSILSAVREPQGPTAELEILNLSCTPRFRRSILLPRHPPYPLLSQHPHHHKSIAMPHRTIARGRKVKPIVAPKTLELNFDVAARQDYLTGFTKRKQARIAAAREAAVAREKQQRVAERAQLRETRKVELAEHVAAVKKEMRRQERILDGKGGLSEDEGEEEGEESWEGIEADVGMESTAAAAAGVEEEAEYTDEEKYTTVTVEAMGDDHSEEGPQDEDREQQRHTAQTSHPREKKSKSTSTEKKPKKKKFRYESKAERQATRQKQKSRNAKAAKARRSG